MADRTALADLVTLTHGNSVISVDTSSVLGVFSWTVDGIDQLSQESIWFRLGPAGAEEPVNSLLQTAITATPNTLNVRYAHANFTVTLNMVLTGGAAGSGQANLVETVTVNNTSTVALALHLFQYADFDVDGDFDGNTLSISAGTAAQTGLTAGVAVSTASPPPQFSQAALVPGLIDLLSDLDPTTLTNVPGPITGDASFANQWDLSVAAAGSTQISLSSSITPAIGALDTDGDGVLDDGDASGTVGDKPCTAGATANCDDNCPVVSNADQADADGDGVGDVCDGCPSDPNKFAPGTCGCGVAEGTCPPGGGGGGGGGPPPNNDTDNDGVLNTADNCPTTSNPEQEDEDGDDLGNACDPDDDDDGADDEVDNCLAVANPNQANADDDDLGDACDDDDDGDDLNDVDDNCPLVVNPGQEDSDSDGDGDACDGDEDGDGVADGLDNCPTVANQNQADADGDGEGDACDEAGQPIPEEPERPRLFGRLCGFGAGQAVLMSLFGLVMLQLGHRRK